MGKVKNKLYDRDLQQEYMDSLAKEIQKEIDDGIVETMMIETLVNQDNWTSVNIMRFPFNIDIVEQTSAWIHCNATGDYKYHNGRWYLEKAQDATALILKFS